ncbi:DUF6644 family protein [Phenylobacterium sp.]|jgi:hypothetical protein|uniref:DUF6644 family protein n=1 Tax=Phenylobacterium sp. TaxID=1871053 RepID=UPI002F91DAA2
MAIIPDNFKQIIPSIEGWIESLATQPFPVALQSWFAVIEVFHILGLFCLAAAAILVGLRLLGVGFVEATPSSIYRNTRLWLHLGVVLAIVSGILMGLSNASKLYDNSAFLWKMIALVAGVIFTYAVLVPTAKREGEVSGGARIGLILGLLVWVLALVVMISKKGGNVAIFHVMFACALISIFALYGALRWIMLIGLVVLVVGLQIATHGVVGDPFTETWMTVNKAWMWIAGVFVFGLAALNIFGRSARPGTTTLSRLVGYAAILIWVTVGAGGRWIGLT